MTLKYHHVYVVVEDCNISAQIATPFPLLNGWHARHVRVESSRSRVPCRADIAPNKTLYNYDSDKFFSVTPRGARSQHLTPNKYTDLHTNVRTVRRRVERFTEISRTHNHKKSYNRI